VLKEARAKRAAIAKATKKLQCLAIAKQYLQDTFVNKTLKHLSDVNYWRSDFKDQLDVNYRDFLLSGVEEELKEDQSSRDFCNFMCDEKFSTFKDIKAPIARQHLSN